MAVRHDHSFIKYRLEEIIVTECSDTYYIRGLNKGLWESSGRGEMSARGTRSLRVLLGGSEGRLPRCSILVRSKRRGRE